MAKQQLIKEVFKLQQIAGIRSLYEFEIHEEESKIKTGDKVHLAKGMNDKTHYYIVKSVGNDGYATLTIQQGDHKGETQKYRVDDLVPFKGELAKGIQEADEDEEEDMEDDWNEVEDSDDDYEQEPTKKDIQVGDKAVGVVGGNQSKLQTLISQKDAILNKFKSGEITIDQYKQEIGNIPQQIKNLQAAIEKQMSGDEGEEEIFERKEPLS